MSRRGIAVVMSGFPRRSETFALNELRALERAGLLAAVFATRPGDGLAPHPDVAEVAHRVCALPDGPVTAQAEVIAERLAPTRPVAVHAYFAHTPAAVAAGAAARLRVPFGFSSHARDARKITRAELGRRARQAACVVACNAEVHQDILRAGGSAHLLPHGVDLARFRPTPLPAAPPLRFLSVARLVPKKGLDVLLTALGRLRFDWRLDVVGEGTERARLVDLAVRLGIADRVAWLGSVTHAELPAHLQRATAVVVPSIVDATGDRDGLPNVVLEAMASGRPVIGTDAGAIRTAVRHEDTGLVAKAGDASALARALGRVREEPQLVSRLVRSARELVTRDFELGRCTDAFLRVLVESYA